MTLRTGKKLPEGLTFYPMSKKELLAFAQKLSARERKDLRVCLGILDRVSDPAWKAEMGRRLKRMRAGRGITDVEYYRGTRGSSRKTPAAAK